MLSLRQILSLLSVFPFHLLWAPWLWAGLTPAVGGRSPFLFGLCGPSTALPVRVVESDFANSSSVVNWLFWEGYSVCACNTFLTV